jgi:excisionase family DNA binding protein
MGAHEGNSTCGFQKIDKAHVPGRKKCPERRTRGAQKDQQTYTIEDLAARWQVSKRTVHRRIKTGELDGFRVGPQIRIHAESVHVFEFANRLR